jgi:hypothetical protein
MIKEKDISKMETLTEKWKKRELELGSYYVKDASGRVFIDEYIELLYVEGVEGKVFRWGEVIVEVVARVPSYDQFSQMVKKVDELEKKLDIAVKALEDYADEENWSTATTEINTDYFEFEYSMYGLEHNGFEDAQKALKEMEEV